MRNVEPGFHVVGSDGTEIGTVANCSRAYCEVSTGILGLGHPIYVPMDAITQTEGQTVFLNVSSERIKEMNWSRRPAGGGEACATSYYGTMPAGQTEQAPASPETARPAEHQAAPPIQPAAATGHETITPTPPRAPPPPSTAATTPGVSELTPAAIESVGRGWPIICAEGKQVGTVASTRPDGLVMERGWFIFRHRVLVPARTIQRIDDISHRVYLAVGCAGVNQFPAV